MVIKMELILLCIKIFLVRIVDVSLGTTRTLFVVKGKKKTAALIGFVEVFIWFIIVREALNTDSKSIFVAISYAAGFAIGTYIGSFLSEMFIKGNLTVQVILNQNDEVIEAIREKGYAVSVIDIKGKNNENNKWMLFIEINKKQNVNLQKLIHKLDKNAFIVINETKYVQNGFIK